MAEGRRQGAANENTKRKAEGRRRKAEGSEKLRIAECGLRNGEKPIAECGMNEALQIDPANPQSEIRNLQLARGGKGAGERKT